MSSKKQAKIKANKDITQGKLKSQLHHHCRNYYKYKMFLSLGKKFKAGITLRKLKRQQADINRIRKEIGKQPITIVEDMMNVIKNL